MNMKAPWKWRIAPSIEDEEAKIRHMDWDEAQEWCNFALMRPVELPAGLRVEKLEVRPEAPPGRYPGMDMTGRFEHNYSNRATVRCTISDGTRQLHLKQLLYDLGPPAYDHPSFWLHQPSAFVAGNDIGWIGKDFRDLQAISLHLHRTMIEGAVQTGDFHDEELIEICRALRPAVPSAHSQILRTPFADLCYGGRYRDLIVTVPMGYWKHRRRPATLNTTVARAADVPASWLKLQVSLPAQYGFVLDTAIAFGDPEQPQEVEWIYEKQEPLGHYVRVLTWPRGAPNAPTYPLEVDRQPCSTDVLHVRGREVPHAFLDERFGQHEVIFERDDAVVMLMVKPHPGSDREWFTQFLDLTLAANE